MNRSVLIALAAVALLSGCTGAVEAPAADEDDAAPSAPAEPAVEAPTTDDGPPAPGEDESEADIPAEPAPAPPSGASRPWNGAWIHLFDSTLKQRSSIEAAVTELAGAGADTLFVQVVRRHDAYYRSDVLPRTVDPLMTPDLDVLEVVTDAAHLRGMRVHAWITVAPTWHAVYTDLEPPDGWITAAHGLEAPEEDRWVTRRADGQWDEYLDLGLLEVHDHIAAIAAELVERYPIDGAHLDYVRYASEQHGYHPRALARFADETGIAGIPEPDDPAWVAWRQDQGRALIERVAAAVGGDQRAVALSAAVVTWGAGPQPATTAGFATTRPAAEALQDWPSWVTAGLVDAVVPMVYFRDHVSEQAEWFGQWIAFQRELAASTDVLVVPGLGGWLNEPEATVRQAEEAAAHGDGVIVYSFQQPTRDESRDVWRLLAEGPWSATADRSR